MILNKFIRFISRAKTRYISCTHYPILHFLGRILRVLQHRLLRKTQVNSLTRRVHGDRVTDFFKLCEIKVSLCSKKVTKAYDPLFRNTR